MEVVQPVVNVKPERPAAVLERVKDDDGFPRALPFESDEVFILRAIGG